MEYFASSWKNEEEQFFGYHLSSARMVIECAFDRLIEIWALTSITCRMLYIRVSYLITFVKFHKEPVNPQYVTAALKYDSEFQSPTHSEYKINNNEGNGKKVRNIYVKYFT